MSNENDDGVPFGEQIAFTECLQLIEELETDARMERQDIARGILIAALSCFRKDLSDTELAMTLYDYADNYATRNLPDGG